MAAMPRLLRPTMRQSSRPPYAAALETNGMSRQTAHRFQALADVPAETIRAGLARSRQAERGGDPDGSQGRFAGQKDAIAALDAFDGDPDL